MADRRARAAAGAIMLDKQVRARRDRAAPVCTAGRAPAASPATRTSNAAPFTIMIPPPNVTGSLHMGHALTFTDPGHADPLAPDAGSRRAVAAGHRPRRHRHPDGGRAAAGGRGQRTAADWAARRSSTRVWQWKAESGGTITRQLRRLGASLDWPRERFTMDEGLSAAVKRDVRHAVRARADLPRPAAGELGPEAADGDLRPGGGEPRDARDRSGICAIRSRAKPAGSSSSPPRGRRRCWATPPWRCIPITRVYAT